MLAWLLTFGLHTYVALGQNTDTLQLTVTQLAGNTVYLDGGSDQGIARGDTLIIIEDTGKQFIVNAVSRKQSIVQFAHQAFPVTRGQQLSLWLVKGTQVAEEEALVTEEEVLRNETSIMAQDTPIRRVARRPTRSRIEVDGRLTIDVSALQSDTQARSRNVPTLSRLYLTPAVTLNATLRNLPSGINMHLHVRSDYRYQTRNPITPYNSFRAYQLSLEKPLPFGHIQLGRFYHRMTHRGGYWDGLSLLVGTRKRGMGGSVGFMPERANEGFSTQIPRYAVFAHYETPRKQAIFYRGALAMHAIEPTSTFVEHRYASLEQQVHWSRLFLRQDLQVDLHPATQSWIVSHLRLDGRVSVTKQVDLRGSYTLRQPYRIALTANPFMPRREQYRVGISFRTRLFSMGGSYMRRLLNQTYEGYTVQGYVNTRPVTPLALSFSGSASRWESALGTALYLNGGIARMLNSIYVRADYGFYRSMSPNVGDPIDMHRVTLTTSIPFNKRLYWSLRLSTQQSPFTATYAAQSSLHIRF